MWFGPGREAHLSQLLFAPSVQGVLADLHHLLEEGVPDLGEAPAGGLHQGLQDGADVGLDAGAEELLGLRRHQGCVSVTETAEEESVYRKNIFRLNQTWMFLSGDAKTCFWTRDASFRSIFTDWMFDTWLECRSSTSPSYVERKISSTFETRGENDKHRVPFLFIFKKGQSSQWRWGRKYNTGRKKEET